MKLTLRELKAAGSDPRQVRPRVLGVVFGVHLSAQFRALGIDIRQLADTIRLSV
jgi:hypothetical protein